MSTVGRLLGRHVVQRAHQLANGGQVVRVLAELFVQHRQTQIEDFYTAVAGEHDVGRLDVAMYESRVMHILQTDGRLPSDLASVRHRQRAEAMDQLRKVGAVDEVHHQIMHAPGITRIAGSHDVGMVQVADHFHFPFEAGDGGRAGPLLQRQQLDRHGPFELGVLCPQHHAHPAGGDRLEHAIGSHELGQGDRGFRTRRDPPTLVQHLLQCLPAGRFLLDDPLGRPQRGHERVGRIG